MHNCPRTEGTQVSAADAGFRRGGGTLVGGTPNTHS